MKFRFIIPAAFILRFCISRPSESRNMADIFKKVSGSVTVVVAQKGKEMDQETIALCPKCKKKFSKNVLRSC